MELSRNANDLKLSEKEFLALHKMYVDEGYHALFCLDMAQQVKKITNIFPLYDSKPSFIKELKLLGQKVKNPKVANIIFTAVSETLITGSLTEVAKEEAVPVSISGLMKDHAKDESRHHAFFKSLIYKIFSNNSLDARSALDFIPEAIYAFIKPDRMQLYNCLTQIGVTSSESNEIISDVYTDEVIEKSARSSAKDLLRFIDRSGMIDSNLLREKLEEKKLIGALKDERN